MIVLTVKEMAAAEAASGVADNILMEYDGRAVANAVAAHYPGRPDQKNKVLVLCGPGNNGGDGYVAARLLKEQGFAVRVAAVPPKTELAKAMAARWAGNVESLASAALKDAGVIVDAIFGAGLSRPLEKEMRALAGAVNESGVPVVAVDVPTGLHGDSGKADIAIRSDLTIAFHAKRPAHLLYPGRWLCGAVLVADIGIPAGTVKTPKLFENEPGLWRDEFPVARQSAHKYARGSVLVVSGPVHATGAARLAARAGLRVGAGLVSVASPPGAVAVNAAHLTAVMVKPFTGAKGLKTLLADKRINVLVLGPGIGVGVATRGLVMTALAAKRNMVLDADALTSFAGNPKALFANLNANCVLTPHEGEFEKLFPGLLKKSVSRVEAARAAAKRSGAVVILKGPDTVIASPDGTAAINTNAPATLATAGSGDVLAGLVGGLMAQGMAPVRAAMAAAWLHGDAAGRFGPGLIAEDLPEMLPESLANLGAKLLGGHANGA